MALQMKSIKRKMKSVANIQKVTKAMEMISVSKMKKSIEKRNASLAFALESRKILLSLLDYHELTHPYLEPGEGERTLLVIVAANRGLCGAYNTNVSRKVSSFLEGKEKGVIDVIAVGKHAQKIALRNGLNLLATFDQFSDYYSSGEVRSLLYTILETFDSGKYRDVLIAYTEFTNSLSYEPKLKSFIPLRAEEILTEEELERREEIQKGSVLFEPSEQEVLNEVVPAVLITILYQYLLESLASEHSARVSAMKNASENAEEMLEQLTMSFNRARQAAITQEIAEIVGASSAISS